MCFIVNISEWNGHPVSLERGLGLELHTCECKTCCQALIVQVGYREHENISSLQYCVPDDRQSSKARQNLITRLSRK